MLPAPESLAMALEKLLFVYYSCSKRARRRRIEDRLAM
jgi:hypothetical protein